MTDEELKDLAASLVIDEYPESLSISETLWAWHADPQSVTDDEWDDLRDRVRELCSTAVITIQWPGEIDVRQ